MNKLFKIKLYILNLVRVLIKFSKINNNVEFLFENQKQESININEKIMLLEKKIIELNSSNIQSQNLIFLNVYETLKLIKSVESKKTIVFLFQKIELWPQWEELIELIRADNLNFNLKILVCPMKQTNHDNQYLYCNRGYHYLKHKKYDVDVIDEKDIKLHDSILKSHITFIQLPYDDTRPNLYRSEFLKQFTDLVYLPYAYIVLNLPNFQFKNAFLNNCKRVYVETEQHKELIKKYNSEVYDKVKVVSHPKLNIKWSYQRIKKSRSKKILWNPRWSLVDKGCTIIWTSSFFFDFLNKHSDYKLIFRPHPLLFRELELPQNKVVKDKIFELIKLENVILDENPFYFDSFNESSFLVTDGSSLLVEYLPTNKPIIFTHNGIHNLNSIGELLLPNIYEACTYEKLEDEINNLSSQKDRLLENRLNFIEQKIQPNINSAQLILQDLKSLLSLSVFALVTLDLEYAFISDVFVNYSSI
jgi:hypothetical protein